MSTQDGTPAPDETAFHSPPGGFAPPPQNKSGRRAEFWLTTFAMGVVLAALVIVEVAMEQHLTWALAKYAAAYTVLMVLAHLAIRRFTPYADPIMLPIVALLNGLGLVLIHRLDLADAETQVFMGNSAPSSDANQQINIPQFEAFMDEIRQHGRIQRSEPVLG